MQKKKKSNISKLLLGMTAMLAAMFLWIGCNSDSGETDPNNPDNPDNPNNPNNPNTPSPTFAPERPIIGKNVTGFELVVEDLKNFVGDPTDEQQSAVIALEWEGEGAITYNLYIRDQAVEPTATTVPTIEGLTVNAAFLRNLEPETDYYIWVEAVNPYGKTLSERLDKSTDKKGSRASGGQERAHYPEGLRVSSGDGSLTVSWNLVDRVGWYEVYYAEVGVIKHLDVYTPVEFRYDSSVELRPDAVDISNDPNAMAKTAEGRDKLAYKSSGAAGHTRPVYPVLTPLAPNGGWEGYYVRDGVSRIDGDTRPIYGVDDLPAGTFYKIYEAYNDGIQDPYKKLDDAFANAIPWDGTQDGTAGTPVKFFGTSTTITGLDNSKTYEVWIRSPNANGERAYSYVVGKPGGGTALPAPSSVKVFTPTDTSRDLIAYWSQVADADSYRVYASKFDYTPNATMDYTEISSGDTVSAVLVGLQSGTTYYVWVVAVKDGLPGEFGTPVTGKTGDVPATGKIGDKIIAGTTEKVKTIVYVEVNDHNPLNAGSYILEDGTYLFDYVTLFAANIRNRTPCDDGCTETGIHVHFNPNVRKILQNRNKYIKPLQDKGIKVLLGLLGDHDGIGFGTMTDEERATFIADLKKDVEENGLDGVDFDDEWGSKEDWEGWSNNYVTVSPNSVWTYPTSSWGYPTEVTVYRNPNMGIVAGNGVLTAPPDADMNRMWRESGESYYKTVKAAREALGTDKIVTLYEYNTGRWLTPSGADNGAATRDSLASLINFALQPWYNRYIEQSANGLSNSIYSPFGMDLSGHAYSAQNGAPNPPIVSSTGDSRANGTIYDYATRFKKAADEGNPYNILYFYAIEPATNLLKNASTDTTASVTREEYLSMMTEVVFGQKTLLTKEGGDYRKDW
jgi:hypothetical protein